MRSKLVKILSTLFLSFSLISPAKAIEKDMKFYFYEQLDPFLNIRQNQLKRNIENTLKQEDSNHIIVKSLDSDYFVDINGKGEFTAASLIKIPVMIATYQKMNDKNKPNKVTEKRVYRMITISSNRDARKLVANEGFGYINKVMENYGFETRVIQNIPYSGKVYKNKTTAEDISDMLEKLYNQEIISDSLSTKMIEILKEQKIGEDRIPKYLPDSLETAHKTGTVAGFVGDAAIVFTEHPYILVIAIDNEDVRKGKVKINHWAKDRKEIMAEISKIVYEDYLERESNYQGYLFRTQFYDNHWSNFYKP